MFCAQVRVFLVGCITAKNPFTFHCRVAWSVYCQRKRNLKKKPKNTQTHKPHSLYLSHPVANPSSFFQSALNSLEVEVAYNPLHLKSNLYKSLKSSLYKPPHRQQPQPREQRPERHQPRQVSPCV